MANITPMKFDPLVRPITHWENTFGHPPLQSFVSELDIMLLVRYGPSVFGSVATTWTPVMEMFDSEADELFVAKLEIPGMKKEEITIELTDSTLVVRGERKAEKEEKKEKGVYTSERTYGSFYRMVMLPAGKAPSTTLRRRR